MNVIRHQAVAKQRDAVALRAFAESFEIETPVVVEQEDVLAIVAPLRDVMRHTRRHHPGHTGHSVNEELLLSHSSGAVPNRSPRSSNRRCGFPASGSPTGFLPQAVAGGGPRCIRRRRSTPNWPNTTWSLNRRAPRDDTFFRLRKNPRTRSHTWLSTARYAISRVP